MSDTASILNVKITTLPQKVIEKQIVDSLSQNKKGPLRRLIFTPNPEMLASSRSNAKFTAVLNSSYLNIPDGWGVVWASRGAIKERITGVDLMERLTLLAGKFGWRVFLLGSPPGVAGEAQKKLKAKLSAPHPNFRIESSPGPQKIASATKEEIDATLKVINLFKPNFLFVGFGHYKQEFFLDANQNKLWFDYAMGVGGAFDMISGRVKRAPWLIQKSGFEWLWRLILEPFRWRRQILIFKFPFLVLKNR